MFSALLAVVAFFAQGIPVLPNQGGTITGVLRSATGLPAAGVRVAAQSRPEALTDLATASSYAGLAETDNAGRFTLENIPPGRYYIVAGRVDAPTYYPGTVQPAAGTIVTVKPGETMAGIDFVLNNASVGRANGDNNAAWVAGLSVSVEGGKIPLFASGLFPVLRFTRPNNPPIDVGLESPNVTLPSTTSDYRVSVVNLPQNYSVKSIISGSTDLKVGPLQFPGSRTIPVGITLVLTQSQARPSAGVRVSGQVVAGRNPKDSRRSIYLSGIPGTVYIDGTFDFVGVLPGRHSVVTLYSPEGLRPLGASVVVGDRDISGVELEEVAVAPFAADQPTAPLAAGARAPGARIPLASIRGKIIDGDSKEPFNAGKVAVNADLSRTFPLNDDGTFEVSHLLPGRYQVEVMVFAVGSVSRTVVIDDQDETLDLSITGAP
jgi:hypothetical protein